MTAARRPETGFAEVNGTKLYYEVLGEGHALVIGGCGMINLRCLPNTTG